MVSKLAWATAMILIVAVAGVGAWAILGGAPATPPSAGGWTSRSVLGFTGGQKSGIVAVYIAKPGQDFNDNWSQLATTDNYYLKQTASAQSGNIPYDTNFVILVEVVGNDDNMAGINLDNLKVELGITGSFTKTAENTDGGDGAETQFTISGTEIGVNAVWDNDGNNFKLSTGGSIDYTTKLWLWG